MPWASPVLALTADAGSDQSLTAAIAAVLDRFGVPDALVYNAAIIRQDTIGQLSAAAQASAWAVNVGGVLTAVGRLAPAMALRGSGSIIVTGGMPTPDAHYVSLSLGKAGVRAVTTMLHQQFGPAGVHAATVTIADAIATGTFFDPDKIAEQYWRLHAQAPADWQHEILYGPAG